jgi:hypothetical protein
MINFADCDTKGLLHSPSKQNQIASIDGPEILAPQCGDFWTPRRVHAGQITPREFLPGRVRHNVEAIVTPANALL